MTAGDEWRLRPGVDGSSSWARIGVAATVQMLGSVADAKQRTWKETMKKKREKGERVPISNGSYE